jgi:LysM repeat protein
LEYNHLSESDEVSPGIILKLQPADNETANTDNSEKMLKRNRHIVQPKEGLYAISHKYKISVAQIKDWNSLTTDELKIGQELIVSP